MIVFNANAEQAGSYGYTTSGEPFQCTCQITDDIGRDYASITYGRCLPHSVLHELKSTRNSLRSYSNQLPLYAHN